MKRFHWGNCGQEIDDLQREVVKLKSERNLAQANVNSQDIAYRELLAQNEKLTADKEVLYKQFCLSEVKLAEADAKLLLQEHELKTEQEATEKLKLEIDAIADATDLRGLELESSIGKKKKKK